ncbi:MAG: VOC family protein [Anaerovoracaceae bacterium]
MKIEHITINSGKLEESVKFYQDVAGLEITRDMRGKGPLNIVFLADEKGDTCIELIGNEDEAYSGEGISIGFEVEDAERYHEELWNKGMEATPLMKPVPGTSFFFVKDPNGVSVQFISQK